MRGLPVIQPLFLGIAMHTFLWAFPVTMLWIQAIDDFVFYALNQTLGFSSTWAWWVMIFNMRLETRLNGYFMALVVVYATARGWTHASKQQAWLLLILYLSALIFLMKPIEFFYFEILGIMRPSPGAALAMPFDLSALYPHFKVVTASGHSFPSGHTVAAVYWALACRHLLKLRSQALILMFAAIFSCERLFAGGHWLSDVLYSAWLAWMLFEVVHTFELALRFLLCKRGAGSERARG